MSLRISPLPSFCSETQEPLLPEVNTFMERYLQGILIQSTTRLCFLMQRGGCVRLAQTKLVTCALISQGQLPLSGTQCSLLFICLTEEVGIQASSVCTQGKIIHAFLVVETCVFLI